MEHPTTLPEEQTLTQVVTEADGMSLNRHRPRIIVTREEPQAETKQKRKNGEFVCANLSSIFNFVFVIKDLDIEDKPAVGLLFLLMQRSTHVYATGQSLSNYYCESPWCE
jgi:hypothetical protein